MDKLPPIYIEEPGYSKKTILGLVAVSLLLLTIPIGVYLSLQNQNPSSQALEDANSIRHNLLKLESEINSVSVGDQIPVTVSFGSETEESNLVASKLTFPTDLLQVVSIATEPGSLKVKNNDHVLKWVESSFDNKRGRLSLVVGLIGRGVQTEVGSRLKIATIIFRAKKTGIANIRFDDLAAIYSSKENSNILSSRKGFNLTIVDSALGQPLALEDQEASLSAQQTPLQIVSPAGGEGYSYNKLINIRWSLADLDWNNINLRLYLNGHFYGKIVSLSNNPGEYDWNPQQTVPHVYLGQQNSFQVEVSGITKNGEIYSDISDGPFTITDSTSFNPAPFNLKNLTAESGDTNGDGFVNLIDISTLLSSFGARGPEITLGDLNSDRVVNDVDLWILRQVLLKNNVIK